MAVGGLARKQGQAEQGHELGQADHADNKGRLANACALAGQLINLPSNGHGLDLYG